KVPMKDALRKKILGDRTLRAEVVYIKSLDASLEVVALRGGEVFDLRANALNEEGTNVENKKLWPALVIAAYRDPETHTPLFAEGDRDPILNLEYAVLEEMTGHVFRLCSIEKAKTEEDVLKNS